MSMFELIMFVVFCIKKTTPDLLVTFCTLCNPDSSMLIYAFIVFCPLMQSDLLNETEPKDDKNSSFSLIRI